MAGLTNHFERYDYGAYLIKLDSRKNIEWSYGYSELPGRNLSNVFQTEDEGYMVIGYRLIEDHGSDGTLIKLDADGEVEWVNDYGTEIHDYFKEGFQLPNGGFAIYTEHYDPADRSRWDGITILDEDAEVTNTIRLGDGSYPLDAILTDDSEMIILAQLGGGSRLFDVRTYWTKLYNKLRTAFV